MNFDFSQEQIQFADALRRWANQDYQFEQRKHIIQSASGTSDHAWAALTELGALALPVPEDQGGFNGSAVDMLVLMQELGRALVVEPYFATVFAAEFLKLAKAHFDILEQVATGQTKLAAALYEAQSRHEAYDIKTTFTPSADGYVLNGKKTVVIHGAQADHLIVSARAGGDQFAAKGIMLFLVDARSAGVNRRDYRTLDGMRAADISFEQVQLPAIALLGREDGGADLLDAALDYGTTLLCAEAVGIMEATIAATLEYLKTRQQFGVPIGKFQVLQHRMADMYMELEQARSMAMLAAVKQTSANTQERKRTVSAAKARVGQAARLIGQQAVQLHGGMGVTNELPVAHMFKRLTMIELSLGDTDHHLTRFIAQSDFVPA
ncbi:acyl-CoA dehydrogenase family protein [Undibacterium sp. CY7W]|uniref:Acyl-CoA dehydrogenase family protein n=1 Tax=Undibacterium rugosum TaxID=2762291 RepID=A0A923I1N5_9BURK|nr:acyl-CoA dehydrogenase family protein [Undibacterium rugosum]MBC3935417.1 acyl-CoA dehydrogenase family protein [Undibacterium rugosum]